MYVCKVYPKICQIPVELYFNLATLSPLSTSSVSLVRISAWKQWQKRLPLPIKQPHFDPKEVEKLFCVSTLIVCFTSKTFYLSPVPLLFFLLSYLRLFPSFSSAVLTRSSAVYCLSAVKESLWGTLSASTHLSSCSNVLFLGIACLVACLCGTHQPQRSVCSLYV